MLAAGFKLETGSCYEVSHGGRDEDLAGSCLRHDPSAGVYCDAADRGPVQLDLSRVHPDPNFKPKRAKCFFDGEPAADGPGRPSKIARKPSPAVSICRPRNRPSNARIR